MKTKNFYIKISTLCLLILAVLQSCKKEATNELLKAKSLSETNQSSPDYFVSTVVEDVEYVRHVYAAEQGKKIYFSTSTQPKGMRVLEDGKLRTVQDQYYSIPMKDGSFFFFGSNGSTISKISPTGKVTFLAGCASSFGHVDGKGANARFGPIQDAHADDQGNIYITENIITSASDYTVIGSYLRKITSVGNVTTLTGGPGAEYGNSTNSRFGNFTISPDGTLYIISNGLLKMSPDGVITRITKFGGKVKDGPLATAEISSMQDITLGVDNTIYFTQIYLRFPESIHVVRKISPDGIVTTIAGGSGIEGEDNVGPGLTARFNYPYGIVYSEFDNALFIADTQNQKIKKIQLPK